MNKIITFALAGFVGMASFSANAVESQVWNPWRKDMCKEGINSDIQLCLKALYCPRGSERTNMRYHVTSRQAEFSEDWKEFFTHCSANCSPSHDFHADNSDLKYYHHG